MTILGPDARPLRTPEGFEYRTQQGDIDLLSVVWRGSQVLILVNRDAVKRFEFDDKRKIADQLRTIFERDFGVLL